MRGLKVKIMTMVLIVAMIALIIPLNVFAAEAEVQVVKTDKGYIIYAKGLADSKFQYAITSEKGAEEVDLNYINSVEDEDNNQVMLIESEKIAQGTNYIHTKVNEDGKEVKTVNEINFENQSFNTEKMEIVENTTKRIKTELKTNLEKINEVRDGMQYTETIGGLQIVDDENATYYYERTKLPADQYSKLQELANELNIGYEEKDMYSKIEYANEFYNLYNALIENAKWEPVEKDLTIKQPIEAQKGEQYVVLLKKVAQDGTETYDAKFMTSYREDEEEKIPGKTETKVVQETAKLPITGDSIILFAILAVIVLALILIFVRMKKLQNKEEKH